MRRLLYVPMIHEEADLGAGGAALARSSSALVGARRWALHRETVAKFWEGIATYLFSCDGRQLRVYQDGLAAKGAMGRLIVVAAAKRGSKNYQLVLELLARGAALRKTEDAALLLREHENLRRSMLGPLIGEGQPNAEQYLLERDRLMQERDQFIAQTINGTLGEGERGVLFIGAFHDVLSHLAEDIAVEAVKDAALVRAYFQELFQGQDDRRLEELAHRLTLPVDAG